MILAERSRIFFSAGSRNVGWPTNYAPRYREIPVEIQVCILTRDNASHQTTSLPNTKIAVPQVPSQTCSSAISSKLALVSPGFNANGSGLVGHREPQTKVRAEISLRHISRHTRDCAICQTINKDGRFRNRLTDIRSVGLTTTNLVEVLASA